MTRIDPDGRDDVMIGFEEEFARAIAARSGSGSDPIGRTIGTGIGIATGLPLAGAAIASGAPILAGYAPRLLGFFLRPEVGIAAGSIAAGMVDQPGANLTRIAGILRPGGRLIGLAGSSKRIRFLDGGLDAAQALFSKISKGGKVVSQNSKLTVVDIPGVGRVVLRTIQKDSERIAATLDIDIAGIGIRKVKFFMHAPRG